MSLMQILLKNNYKLYSIKLTKKLNKVVAKSLLIKYKINYKLKYYKN